MERSSLKRRPVSLLAALAALPLLWTLLAQEWNLIFAMDDFAYAAYWRGGLSAFWERTVLHYQQMNGRALVHAVAQTVLASRSEEFCGVVNFLVLCGVFCLAWQALGRREAGGPLSFALLPAALLLLLPPESVRETLLWTSAFYNYVFPMALLLLQIGLVGRWQESGSWKLGLAAGMCSFLAGATTELYGLMSAAAALLLALCRLVRTRSGWPRLLLSLPCAALGAYTVFASPATQLRMGAEMAAAGEALTAGRWDAVAGALFGPEGGGALAAVLALFLAAALLGAADKARRVLLVGIPFALLMAPTMAVDAQFDTALVLTAAMAVLLLFQRGLEPAGALLAAGGCGALAIAQTGSVAPRTVLPFLLSVMLAAAALFVRALGELDKAVPRDWQLTLPAVALAALTLAVLTGYAPTGRAIAQNAALDRDNRLAVRQAAEIGGDALYCVDYDPRYCHRGIARDADAYRNYLLLYGLTEEQLWFTSGREPWVSLDGRRLHTLAGWLELGEETLPLFPVAEVLERLGGSAVWKGDGFAMELDGRSCLWADSHYTFHNIWGYDEDYTAYTAWNSCVFQLPADVLRIVFGIQADYDEKENCFRLTYVPALATGAVAGA